MGWSFLGNMYFRCVCFWGVFFFFIIIIIHISRIYLILYNVCNRTPARVRACVCVYFLFLKRSSCAEISRYDHIVHDNIYNRSR